MRSLENIFYMFASLILLAAWLAGFVIAKGFWSTLSCTFPFYAWYLVVEQFILKYNIF